MILKLLLYRKGMLRISVTGESYDRFLNLCANHGIALWNLEYHGNAYEMDISVQGFRMLRPLVKKSRTRVRIIRRQGLPVFFISLPEEKDAVCRTAVRYPASVFHVLLFVADRY